MLRAVRTLAVFTAVFMAAFGLELAATPSAFAAGTTCTQVVTTWGDLTSYFAAPTGDCVALGADITNAGGENLTVASGQAITLDLAGNTLTISGLTSAIAGINVADAVTTPVALAAGTFTVDDSSGGSGHLTVTGGPTSAGIGGNVGKTAGQVTITGGTVTATGGNSTSTGGAGAGIGGGGGLGSSAGGSGAGLTVSGGTVTAIGGGGIAVGTTGRSGSAAGVGGGGGAANALTAGPGGNGFPVVVSGGSLDASSSAPSGTGGTGGGGAGVGGGGAGTRINTSGFPARAGGSESAVTVSGGTLTAMSAADGSLNLAEDVGSGGGTPGMIGPTPSSTVGAWSISSGGTLRLERYEFVPRG
jgi:hypothetical protein